MSLDIISYGEASKAKRMLESSKTKIGSDAQQYFDGSESFDTVKARVDALTNQVIAHYKLTDDLAIQNSINIIKAHQQLNLMEKLVAFEGDSMLFDDLVDLSGIDLIRSDKFTHQVSSDQIVGASPQGTVITIPEKVDATRPNLIYTFDADVGVQVYITRDEIKQDVNGNDLPVIWTELPEKEGRFISKAAHITSSELRFKFIIPNGKRLFYYGWVIA